MISYIPFAGFVFRAWRGATPRSVPSRSLSQSRSAAYFSGP